MELSREPCHRTSITQESGQTDIGSGNGLVSWSSKWKNFKYLCVLNGGK